MKVKRNIIQIDEALCDGCGACVPACAEGALAIIDGKARVISDVLCDGLGDCLGRCPRGALVITERDAEEFDESAVAGHRHAAARQGDASAAPCCPSEQLRSDAGKAENGVQHLSELQHWPVQIRLVPPDAPFLQKADLLVAADCTAFANASFHRDFIRGRAVLIGCPKFDDREAYRKKLTDIFIRSDIRSITVAVMEVPCCQGLPRIVQEAVAAAGRHVPVETAVLSLSGAVAAGKKDAA